MENDVIARMLGFDLDKPIETSIEFYSDEEDVKYEIQKPSAVSTSLTVNKDSEVTKLPKSISYESTCEIVTTETINHFDDNIKEVPRDLPILVEDGEISPYFSNSKETKRKISSSGNDEHIKKRISLDKVHDIPTKLATDVTTSDTTKKCVTNTSSETQNVLSDNSLKPNFLLDAAKSLTEDLLRTCEMLLRNGFDTVKDISNLDFRNFISYSMIAAIDLLFYGIEKYEEFATKLVDYALIRCTNKYSRSYLLELFKSMIQWVKNEKSKKNTKTGLSSDMQPHINNTHLESTVLNKNTSNTDKTCLYSNGPPGREINISVDAMLLKQITIQTTTCTSTSATVMTVESNTTVQPKTVTRNTSQNNSVLESLLAQVPWQNNNDTTNVQTKQNLNKNRHLKHTFKMPNLRTDVEETQRSYHHPMCDPNTGQLLLPPRESQIIQKPIQNAASAQPNLNHRPNNGQITPQRPSQLTVNQSTFNSANYQGNIMQQRHSNILHNQISEYNRLNKSLYTAIPPMPPAKRQLPQAQAAYDSQTTYPLPPPPYHQHEYRRHAFLTHQIPQTQPTHYQNMEHVACHQRPPYSASQARQNISNMTYPPRSYNYQANFQNTSNQMQSSQSIQPSIYMPDLSQQEPLDNNIRAPLQDSKRSSSTDSGFTSPLNFNTSGELTANIDEEALNPIITHVTSLNPSAIYIEDGPCSVCSSLTRKKCIECLNCYYCSIECQQIDWKHHQNICKPARTS